MDYEKHMEQRVKARVRKGVTKGGKIFLGILFGFLFAFLFGYLLMLLWNWLMPSLFGLPGVTYWQAIGIFVLAKVLFGFGGPGMGKGGGKHPGHRKRDRRCSPGRWDKVEKWWYYDDYWKEEGEEAFNRYIARKNQEKEG